MHHVIIRFNSISHVMMKFARMLNSIAIVSIIIILLQRYPFSNTLSKGQLTTLVKNKNANLTGSCSLRGHTLIFIAHTMLFQMAFE